MSGRHENSRWESRPGSIDYSGTRISIEAIGQRLQHPLVPLKMLGLAVGIAVVLIHRTTGLENEMQKTFDQ